MDKRMDALLEIIPQWRYSFLDTHLGSVVTVLREVCPELVVLVIDGVLVNLGKEEPCDDS